MFGIGIVEMLLLLVVLGFGAAVLLAIVFAVSKHPGVALAIGGVTFVALLFGALFVVLFASYQTHGRTVYAEPHYVDHGGGGSFTVGAGLAAWPLVALLGIGLIVLIGFFATRHGTACAANGWRPGVWLLALLVPLALLFGARVQWPRVSSVQVATPMPVAPMAPVPPMPPVPEISFRMSAQQVAELSAPPRHRNRRDSLDGKKAAEAKLQREQEMYAKGVAAMNADFPSRIATMDFQQLFEEFYKPRIELTENAAPENQNVAVIAAASPEAVVATAVTSVDQGAAETTQIEQPTDDKRQVGATSNGNQSESVANSRSQNKKPRKPADKHEALQPAEQDDHGRIAATAKQNLPDWVDDLPGKTPTGWREVIKTDEYASTEECFQAAQIYKLLKTYERMQVIAGLPLVQSSLPSLTFIHNGPQARMILADGQVIWTSNPSRWTDSRIQFLESVGITSEIIHDKIVKAQAIEKVERSFGPMEKLHVQIEFTPEVDRQLRQHWDAHRRQERFWIVGTGGASILGLLGMVFGLLKVDTWTKGYYTKRLFIGVPLALFGGFGLYAALVEMGFDLPH